MASLLGDKRGSRPYVVGSLVALLCIAAYGPGLVGPFFFDDVTNLTANQYLQISGTIFDDWRVASFSSDAGPLRRPLAMFSFALNYVISEGFSPLAVKGSNLALHLLCGGLVFVLCRQLLAAPALWRAGMVRGSQQRQMIALLAAAIWLLHPLHVSTVLYAVQRMAQLSALFVLLGLAVFVAYRQRWAERGAPAGEVMAAALWLLLIALFAALSKENGALLLWLVVVVEVTLYRGCWAGQERRGWARLGWLVCVLPLLLVVLVFAFAPDMITARFGGRAFTLEERLLTQLRVLWRYLAWIVFPNILQMGFFHDDIAWSRTLFTPVTGLLSLVMWLLSIAAALFWHRRYPLLAFTLGFYLVAHSMESSFWPLEMVFEHRNYLPSVAVCLLLSLGVWRIAQRLQRLRWRIAAGGLLVVLAALLGLRSYMWADETRLARFNVVNHPHSARANFFYANALFKRFEQAATLPLEEDEQRALAVTARHHFRRMHEIDPADFSALVMLYQLDALHFPGLLQEEQALQKLQRLALTRRLQSSDRTALAALVGFLRHAPPGSDRAALQSLLDTLVERFYWRTDLMMLQHDLMTESVGADRSAALAFLAKGVQRHPARTALYPVLLAHYGRNDMAGGYEVMAAWMLHDKGRRDLSVIRGVFRQ